MNNRQPRLPLLAALLFAAFCILPQSGAAADGRIVAIGDVHGAYEEFVEILKASGLIDDSLSWAGGDSRFVQTGDFTDRGSGVRDTIELLMRLEQQAPNQGGEVHILLGNHEAMNLIADDQDVLVNHDIPASFADARSQERREAAFEAFDKWRQRRKRIKEALLRGREVESSPALTAFMDQSREEWLAAHPAGLIEYREAMSIGGEYGRWILDLPVAVKLDDTLFLHGGIGALSAELTLDQITRQHRKQFKDFATERRKLERRRLLLPQFSWLECRLALEHQLRFPDSAGSREMAVVGWDRMNKLQADLFADQSPLWFRGYARSPLGLGDEPLAELLDLTDSAYGVHRTVAAHSPVTGHAILSRLDGRLFLIDTGMLGPVYGGRASALEISGASVSGIYADPALGETSLGSGGGRPKAEETLVGGGPGVYEPARFDLRRRGSYRLASYGANEEQASSATAASDIAEPRVFYGLDGEPLPFQERDQIERFLREAVLLSKEPVGQGKTGAEKVVLERDGVRAHAVRHTIDDKSGSPNKPVTLADGSKVMYFLDSYRGQVAVYELSKLIGMSNVPPAVEREIDGQNGSLALWIENGTNLFTWRENGNDDPKNPRIYLQMHDMRVFDTLVHNTDRNSQNIFWTGDFDLWLIDHTRTMSQDRVLSRADRVGRVSRALLEGIRGLSEDDVKQALKPYVSSFEIKALFNRRKKLLKLIDQRIDERGEENVVFESYDGPRAASSGSADRAIDG